MRTGRKRNYPWKRRQRRVLIVTGLLAILVALPFVHGAFARAKIAEQYRILRAAGEPATLDELAQWLPYPPDGENRAGLYQQAFSTPITLDRDAALAFERYRIKTGQPPATLEELVPEFLESMPIDPFDGQPLRYRRSEKGYVVYSISENLQDEGGVRNAQDKTSRNRSARSGDWVFEVVR